MKKMSLEDKWFFGTTLLLLIPMGFNIIFGQIYIVLLIVYIFRKTYVNKTNKK